MKLRLLRLVLGFAALTWGISIVGVFLSWSAAANALQGLGAQPIAYDRMLDYWLRMAAGAFGLIGCWYFVLMIWPQRFHAAIPWFGGLMLVEGVILLVPDCVSPFRRSRFTATLLPALLEAVRYSFCRDMRSPISKGLFPKQGAANRCPFGVRRSEQIPLPTPMSVGKLTLHRFNGDEIY